jgi:hypothetical protein
MKSLLLKSFLVISLVLILASCGTNSNNGTPPSNSSINDNDNTSLETIIPGQTECDNAGEVSPDGKYVCAGRGAFYWVSLLDLATNVGEDSGTDLGNNSNDGYWTTKCATVEFPNPNYDARKGFSAVVNEPTVRTQQCSQVWVKN